jgi:hypothetical protein
LIIFDVRSAGVVPMAVAMRSLVDHRLPTAVYPSRSWKSISLVGSFRRYFVTSTSLETLPLITTLSSMSASIALMDRPSPPDA